MGGGLVTLTMEESLLDILNSITLNKNLLLVILKENEDIADDYKIVKVHKAYLDLLDAEKILLKVIK